jgi:hypothetical protein
MSARRIEYHQGAVSDVRSAISWYQKHSHKAALEFIKELQRATNSIAQAPERWPVGPNDTRRFLLCDFLFRSSIRSENPQSQSGPWLTSAGARSIGRRGFSRITRDAVQVQFGLQRPPKDENRELDISDLRFLNSDFLLSRCAKLRRLQKSVIGNQKSPASPRHRG